MLKYEGYTIHRVNNQVKFSADCYHIFDSISSEDYSSGTPKCWDNTIKSTLDLKCYDCYFVCTCTVSRNKCNRITDYKHIWGLTNTKKGIYENSYINSSGKVYFGIIKTEGSDLFTEGFSSIIILNPKGQYFEPQNIFEIFNKNQYDFYLENNNDIFLELQKSMPKCIILRYCIRQDKVNLIVYAHNIWTLFSNNYIDDWENSDSGTTSRKLNSFLVC